MLTTVNMVTLVYYNETKMNHCKNGNIGFFMTVYTLFVNK